MPLTNFASLTTEQKTAWARDVWRTARQNSFVMQLSGDGMNNVFQRITELTQSEKGTRAVITLVPDLESDGVVGDYILENNEEAAKAYDRVIEIDQMRNANRIAGRMADQKSVVNFRRTSRDLLGYWLADRVDQLASLTLSGIDYRLRTNGGYRPGFSDDGTGGFARDTVNYPVGKALFDLAFAASVKAPSANRHFRWDGTNNTLAAGDITAVAPGDTLTYAALVEAKAHAKDRRLQNVRASGMELYHVFMHPKALAKLKLDPDFLANVRNAGVRGDRNPLFTGSIVTVDGMVIHEWTHAFNTLGAVSSTTTGDGVTLAAGKPGYKWGDGTVDGSRVLICGAQALAFADIGIPEWDERDHFDYGAQPGIAVSKICGFLKPDFISPIDGTVEDFGVIALDVAI